jgi:hypothetical protein
MFSDTAVTPTPPNGPPDPPDTSVDPDCPASISAPHSVSTEYGQIVVEPPTDESIISYYDVLDTYGTPVSVGTVNPPGDPIGVDGKYHKNFPALVHFDPSTNTYNLSVQVVSVSYAGNRGASCSSTSWSVSAGIAAGTNIESAAYTFAATGIADTAYDAYSYSKVVDVTKKYATTIDDPTNDFFVVPSGNAQGVICPKVDGEFIAAAAGLWAAHADTGFRAICLAVLNLTDGVGLHTLYLTLDDAGTGNTTGDTLVLSGGTLPSGGFPLEGTIVATAGAITGIIITNPGIGYSVAPTVTPSVGTATITAHLPAAFTFADINFDCTQDALGHAKGAIWDEDIKAAVDSTITSVRSRELISMHKGNGLLVGIQQGSGTTLDIYDETSDTVVNPRRPRISIFRLPPAAPLAEQYAECPPGG